jgi:hypothetical protein
MLNFPERTGCGAVIVVWSFLRDISRLTNCWAVLVIGTLLKFMTSSVVCTVIAHIMEPAGGSSIEWDRSPDWLRLVTGVRRPGHLDDTPSRSFKPLAC